MSRKNQIVWVFGASAVGKETFIRHLLKTESLRSRLGLYDRAIACEESLRLIAQYDGDPVGAAREGILSAVVQLADESPEATILIKGQDLDLMADRLNRLRTLLPNASHFIIYLDADLEEQYRRIQRKPWYHEGITIDVVKMMYFSQLRLLDELTGFQIGAVSSDRGDEYPSTRFPLR